MKEQFKTVKVTEVQESKTNPRKNYDNAALKELAESIKTHGIIQPLVVRAVKKGYELVAGSRRLRAAKEAKLKEIPVIVKELTDDEVVEIQIIENLQRQDIHPLDEAEGFKNLIDSKKYTVESIAEKIGKSMVYVYQRMKLTSLIPEVKKLFRDNHCSYGQAAVIARLLPEVQKELYADEYRGGERPENVSLGDIKGWISGHSEKDLTKARFDLSDGAIISSAGACTSCHKNTACDTQLFPDFANKKICTDVKCYKLKEHAFLVKQYEELKAKDANALMISDFYGDPGKSDFKNVVNNSNYNECKKSDKGARLAIVVQGYANSDIGKVKYVTLEKPSSGRSGAYSNPADVEQRKANARAAASIKVRLDFIEEVFDKPDGLKIDNPEILKILFEIILRDFPSDIFPKLRKYFDWKVEKLKNGQFDYVKLLTHLYAHQKNPLQFILEMIMWEEITRDHTFDENDPLRRDKLNDIAKVYGVDLKKDMETVKKVAVEELTAKIKAAKEKKKSAKK